MGDPGKGFVTNAPSILLNGIIIVSLLIRRRKQEWNYLGEVKEMFDETEEMIARVEVAHERTAWRQRLCDLEGD